MKKMGTSFLSAFGVKGIRFASLCCLCLWASAACAQVPAISGSTDICVGATSSLSDAYSGGTWSSSNTSVGTIDASTGMVTGVGTGTTTITYFVNSKTTTITVTVEPAPYAGSISGSSVLCAGATMSLSDPAAGGVWSSGTPGSASIGATGIVTGVATGTTTISYTVSNSCGAAVATRTVTVNAAPNAGTITGSGSLCTGATTSLTDAAGGGTWHSSATTIAIVGTSGIITGVATGTATISYTVTNSCGSATATKIVTVSIITVAPITGPTVVITGASIALTDATAGGAWSASNANATVSGGIVTGVSAGLVTISYTLTGPCGTVCATRAILVTAASTVPAITGYFFDMCVGATRPYFDAMPGGTWSISPVIVATVSATGIVTGLTAGTATLSYTVGSVYATTILTVHAVPAPITGDGVLCVGDTATLHDATPGGTWSSGIPAKASVTATGFVTALNTSHIPPPIYYTIGTCRATFILTINFPPLGIYGPNKVCQGATVTLHNDSVGGAWTGSNSFATVSALGDVTGLMAGTTNITYTIANGCSRILQMTVNPLPAPISGTLHVCTGHVAFVSDATPGVSWSSSNPSIATISGSGGITGISPGTAAITYTGINGCTRTAVATVDATPAVTPILGPSFVLYSGLGITLSDLTPGGVWTSSNTAILTVGSGTGLVIANVSAGSAYINYIVTSAAGCTNFAYKIISTSPAPPGHRGSTTTTTGETISVTDEPIGGEWNSSDNTIATVDKDGTINALEPGVTTITHTVTNDDGSISVTTRTLLVTPLSLNVALLPNPNRGTFSVRGTTGSDKEEQITFEITDMAGHIIYIAKATAPGGIVNQQIMMNGGLASGLYVLTMRTGNAQKKFRFVVD